MSNEDVHHKINERKSIWTTIKDRRKKEQYMKNVFNRRETGKRVLLLEKSWSYLNQIVLGLGNGSYEELLKGVEKHFIFESINGCLK